jgi:hypothetical protein
VTVDDAEVRVIVIRLPLGELAEPEAVAVIVGVIVERPGEAVKNARLAASDKIVVAEEGIWIGGNVTVSLPEPNGCAVTGALVIVWAGCTIGWLRPSIW